ncbi:putative Ig domain-containing protein [Chromobacterium piscinae]|uniref:putative Ig domain-containing protein n=1 Tax=Chromobacterium piscinae TaxID=686831 RepID=UPI0022AF805E|nr:putative Ig domain-containing protein [Chromobacterium piscinae]
MSTRIDLSADKQVLLRAAYTAMDQTYGKTAAGYQLQGIDNSGNGKKLPWDVPPGWVITRSVEDPGQGGKVVIYRNEASNQVMAVAMGTNGNGDMAGWNSNFQDFGMSQWHSQHLDVNGKTLKDNVYEALNKALETPGAQLVCAGDSKGGAIAQFICADIVLERDSYKTRLKNLAAVSNESMAVIANSAPGSEAELSSAYGHFDPQLFAGISSFYSAARMEDHSATEIVSQTGGAYLANTGNTLHYFDQGVGLDSDRIDHNANKWVYLHRLAYSGVDGMEAIGGDFSRLSAAPRDNRNLDDMVMLGGWLSSIGKGDSVTTPEAASRIGASFICGFAAAPLSAGKGALEGRFGWETVAGLGSLGLWASGFGPLLMGACAVPVAGSNAAKFFGDPKLVTSNTDLPTYITMVGAPKDAPAGSQRYFGMTSTGGRYVVDLDDHGSGQMFCEESQERSQLTIQPGRVDISRFDAKTGEALSDGVFQCTPSGATMTHFSPQGPNAPVKLSSVDVLSWNATTLPWAQTQILDGNAANAAGHAPLNANQFAVDATHRDWASISAATGVSVNDLITANPGSSIVTQFPAGQVINLPAADNHLAPSISIHPDPIPQSRTQGEGEAMDLTRQGFIDHSATLSIGFGNGMLNHTDLVSTTAASMASACIRPGEVQNDNNDFTNNAIAKAILAPASMDAWASLNAATIGSQSANCMNQVYIDPLVLDLSGKGIGLTSFQSNPVLFDIDHSGTLKRTGWTDGQTGFLAVANADGKVTDISQMFSQYFGGQAGSNGGVGTAPYANGFAALAAQDSNKDGVIDANDAIWNSLRVWVDANHDGKVGSGEMKSMADLGITRIDLHAQQTHQVIGGNIVTGTATFVMQGQTHVAADVNLVSDPTGNTFESGQGGTTIHSSSTGPNGKREVKTYQDAGSANVTLDAAKLGVDNLYAGSGNDTLIAAAGGSWLVGGGGSNVYQGGAGNDVFVVSAKDDPANIHGGGGTDMLVITGDKGMTINMAQAGVTIAEGGQGDDVIMSGGRNGVYIKGGTGNDMLIGGAGTDVIMGGSGHNTIIGGSGQAIITAGPSGDIIYGAQGDSVINAGGGADTIYGGAGNDVIKVGMGNATIDGGGGTNIVQFHGSYADYRIMPTEDGGYWVADKIPHRDGTVYLKNIQKLNFSDIQAVDLSLPNPMPVADTLRVDQAGKAFDHLQPHLISAAQLLANDQRLRSQGALRIASVGSAQGGTVSLTASGDVLFTPTPGYNGVMGFKYGVGDAAGHGSSVVQDLTSGQTAPMQASVTMLTPELPDDPLLGKEWYLSDADILPVWKDYSGKGVRIAQFEPGGEFAVEPEIFDYRHPDLAPNVDPAWLQTMQSTDAMPKATSNHATMVAGVMVAAKNGQGGVGVAYDATLSGYNLANSGSDLSGLGHMVSYDIANHSWGFKNDFALSNYQDGTIDTAASLVSNAQYAADNGRGGLGTVIVAAGGNARATGGSAQGSLTNNNRFSIEVGAINAKGDLSTLQIGSTPFSNPGASLLVSAPGSNVASTSQMVMTDQGSTFGNAYSTMEGTSFATPIVSGVVALMLQANPHLGYRDVQEILALTARQISDAATSWDQNAASNWNGGGMHVSHDYGFGEVDARAAVRLAESWMTQQTGANEVVYSAASGQLNLVANGGAVIQSALAMQSGLQIEHVEVDLDAAVGRLGDVVVSLVAPNGTRSILLNREGKVPAGFKGASDADVGSTRSGAFRYTFMTTHDWGELSTGNWTLQVSDANGGQPVTLNHWALRLYGQAATADHTFYYTDEYKAQVQANGQRAVLDAAVAAAGGGRNTIDAAAISGDVSINLRTGEANLAGTALAVRSPGAIQNLVSGDGNDTLVAGDADALLDGGRGRNTLVGGAGKDLFVVHRRDQGLDTIANFRPGSGELIDLVGFAGKRFQDLVLTQQGNDVSIDLGAGQHILVQNVQVGSLNAANFVFQDSLTVPASYIQSGASPSQPLPAGSGTIALKGGAAGISLSTSATGQMVASLAGTVYSHDAATSDVFEVQKQDGAKDLSNAVRGFKHGIDKIDLRPLGISNFADLDIALSQRMVINGLAQVHGTMVGSKALGSNGKPLNLVYLDTIDPAQLSADDFIFSPPKPGQAGTVDQPVAPANGIAGNGVQTVTPNRVDATTIVGTSQGIVRTTDEHGRPQIQSAIDMALPEDVDSLRLTGSANIIGMANHHGDTLTANDGNDVLIGGDGDDVLVAGKGRDRLIGGAGHNTYVVSLNGGRVQVEANAGRLDTLSMQGVQADMVQMARQGKDLLLSVRDGQGQFAEVVLQGQGDGRGVGSVVLADRTLSAAALDNLLANGNVQASQPALTSTAKAGETWKFTLPDGLFSATASGDALHYQATLANGASLPDWLKFDPRTRQLTGTPTNQMAGAVALQLTAIDMAGKSAVSTLTVQVQPDYQAPTVGLSLPAQFAAPEKTWQFALPDGLFRENVPGDTLAIKATLANGDPLPSWLSFDEKRGVLSGQPVNQVAGDLVIKLTATDMGGLSASTVLPLHVQPAGGAPQVAHGVPDQTIKAGQPWQYTLPADVFKESIAGDALRYSIGMANGGALPDWLHVDAQSGQLSGTPRNAQAGTLALSVTATDQAGLSSQTTVNLQVTPTYQAPTVSQTLPAQALTSGSAWSWTMPAGLFQESVSGDSLRYSVTMANGDPLPAWLSFDPASGVLAGMPTNQTTGTMALQLVATDMGGLSAGTPLSLNVSPRYQAPDVMHPLPDQTLSAGTAWQFALPTDLFHEAVPGDTLSLRVTLDNGDPLPAWVQFDPISKTLSGLPTDQTTGSLKLKVTASDQGGLSNSAAISVTVNPVYQAPKASKVFDAQDVVVGKQWSYALANQVFTSAVAGDTLSYSVAMRDGSALPGWLKLDPATGVLSGLPAGNSNASLDMVVTASDMAGLKSNMPLSLTLRGDSSLQDADSQPQDQNLQVGTPWSYTLPAGMIKGSWSDRYNVAMADGSPLPSWLTYDSFNGALYGTPPAQTSAPITLKITAAFGGGSDGKVLHLQVGAAQQQPAGGIALPLQHLRAGTRWSYMLPPGLLSQNRSASYSATLLDGSPLPAWLQFSSWSGIVSGMPTDQMTGNVAIKISTGGMWGEPLKSTELDLQIRPVYHAPTASTPAGVQGMIANQPWQFNAAGLFAEDIPGDSLTYKASLANGQALPAWLALDPVSGKLSGTPDVQAVGDLSIQLTATDLGGLAAATTLNLHVCPHGQAPVLGKPLGPQTFKAGTIGSYVLPADLFSEPVVGDTLRYTVTLENGNPLPDWLSFAPETGSLRASPGNANAGTFNLKVTATDLAGLSTSTALPVAVVSAYAVPRVNYGTHVMLTPGAAWSYTLPSGMFSSGVDGDTLSYGVTLSNGDPIPAWLHFDPGHLALSGTPVAGSSGVLGLKVTATDMGGLAASSSLDLVFQPHIATPDASGNLPKGNDGVFLVDSFQSATGGDEDRTAVVNGTFGNLVLGNGNNTVFIGGAMGKLTLGNGNNTVVAQQGSNTITLGNGRNTITTESTASSVTLQLGDGNNAVSMAGFYNTVNLGKGNNTLDYITGGGTLNFNASATADHLWFKRMGQNLEIDVVGSAEQVTLLHWFDSGRSGVSIRSGDNRSLGFNSVDKLVQAMAALAPPPATVTSLPADYLKTLAPALSSSWGFEVVPGSAGTSTNKPLTPPGGVDLTVTGKPLTPPGGVDLTVTGKSLTPPGGHESLGVNGADKLVQAMAAFVPPPATTSILASSYQKASAPTLASSWG